MCILSSHISDGPIMNLINKTHHLCEYVFNVLLEYSIITHVLECFLCFYFVC